MYKVLLFDLDGTLTESGEGIMKSVQYALEKIAKPEPELEKLRIFVGPPLIGLFMKYAGVDEETAGKALAFYRERYAAKGIYECRLYAGVPQMLEELCARGYQLAVASSKEEEYVKQILEHFNLTSYFQEIVGSEIDGPRTRKADVIEEALQRMGYQDRRDKVLMIGDKEHDVSGARVCSLECLAVSYGYGSMEELEAVHPLKIVHSLKELVDYLV